jgi:hypothetical protein
VHLKDPVEFLLESLKLDESKTYNDYPDSATNNAKKALEWREKYPSEIKGGTRVGWVRANQLAKKEKLSEKTIARIASFARHRKNAEVSAENKSTPWKDAGYVAYLIWGGETMIQWASRKLQQIRKNG